MGSPKGPAQIFTANYEAQYNTNTTNNANSPLYEVSGNMS